MPEGDGRDRKFNPAPDSSIKQSSIETHTLAVNNIRTDLKDLSLNHPDVEDLVRKAEAHEQAVSLLSRDQHNLPQAGESPVINPSKNPTKPTRNS